MKEQFLKDVKAHKMTIEHDEGVHRSLFFGRECSSAYYFRIVTWPWCLCIEGDMGCFVWQRERDMVTDFFGDMDGIDPRYLARKLQAGVATRVTVEQGVRWLMDVGGEEEKRVLQAMKEEGFPDDVRDFFETLAHLDYADYFDVNCEEFTESYLWCCYAVLWGLDLYRKEKEETKC